MIFTSFHLLLSSFLISFGCCVLPGVDEPVCVEAAGPANPQHCKEIIANQMPGKFPAGSARYTFSQSQTNCAGSLPAYLRRKSCLIVVNTLDYSLMASGSWKTVRDRATRLVDTCVLSGNGAGGHLRMASGLYLAVWSPSSYVGMARSTGGFVPQCIDNVPSSGVNWDPGST